MKVAVLGLSPTTHDLAPLNDPDWEVWGLPWDRQAWPYMSRVFEMHDLRLLESVHSRRSSGYLEFLSDIGCPLYMQDDSLPGATAYPFEAVAETIGEYYFNSSVAYALALAIHDGAEEIAIYGVDMKADDEYGYQKPNMEYLIGIARGRGIKVTIPEASPLCKFQNTGIRFYDHVPTYHKRYGWLG
jgi:hypothetical protein